MPGWTQFTARFEEEQHADGLQEDVDIGETEGDLRVSYNETLGNIARVRLVGYGLHDDAVALLEAAGPLDFALVADFNDTSDGGSITAYGSGGARAAYAGPDDSELYPITTAESPEAARWSFELTVGGLTETGIRAGNDFTLEQEYGEAEREVVPLDELERISEQTLEMLKTEAQVASEEFRKP
jgi:hypothetical protein